MLLGTEGCYDKFSCERKREEHIGVWGGGMSTKSWAPTYKFYGINSPDRSESPMADANKAVLVSCTSDWYMGEAETSKPVPDLKFRGSNMVQALFNDLIQRQGLGSHNTTQTLVFGGFSTGAVGAMYHLDNVAASLKPHNVRTLGYLDSPLHFDHKAETKRGLAMQIKSAFLAHKPSPRLAPESCTKSFDQ